MREEIKNLASIIEWTMNSKDHRWTIKSREDTLNAMWKLVMEHDRKLRSQDEQQS